MTGTYEHSIDAKGRLFIPAKLREELGVTFYLAMGVDECLAIYPQETWNRFTEKFASLPMSQSAAMRPLFDDPAVIAVGEIGLDHHWPLPAQEQYDLFEAQLPCRSRCMTAKPTPKCMSCCASTAPAGCCTVTAAALRTPPG